MIRKVQNECEGVGLYIELFLGKDGFPIVCSSVDPRGPEFDRQIVGIKTPEHARASRAALVAFLQTP
jgi:hypothetical protein